MIKSLMLINAYYCLILKYHRFNGNQVILTRNPNKWVEIHALSGKVASAAWSGPAGGAENLGYGMRAYNINTIIFGTSHYGLYMIYVYITIRKNAMRSTVYP